jgi:tetratricopeptide (TPR) repeat protein
MGCHATGAPPPAVSYASRDLLLSEARREARSGSRERAREMLDERLRVAPGDDEARAELARLDAWDGRWAASEAGYRRVLARHPEDAEVRAGLVDVFLWQSRWEAAEAEIRIGLARSPGSAPLLLRRARLAHWQGDATTAAGYLDEAERASPEDAEVRAMRDAVFRGEARMVLRGDVFFAPGGVQGFPAAEVSALQAWRTLRLSARSEHSLRYGVDAGSRSYNGLHFLGAAWVPSAGWMVHLELGVGAPAVAVPRWLGRVGLSAPIGSRLTVSGSYSHWRYDSGQVVQLFNPAVGVAVTSALRVEARYWFAYVVAPGALGGSVEDGVSSFGLRASWRPTSRFELGGEYTYGVQLDRLPVGLQLVAIRAHIVSINADVRIARAFGLRPSMRVELRTSPGDLLPIVGPELGVYTRW